MANGRSAAEYIGITTDITERVEAEETLKRQSAHLDELFELSPDAIVLTNLSDPRIIRVNKEFTKVFRYTAEEAVRTRLRSLIVPPGASSAGLAEDPALIESRKIEREVVRPRKDGALFHAHVTRARIQLQDQPTAAHSSYRDISERKRGEALLARENRVLEMIAKGDALRATLDALCRLIEEIFSGCAILYYFDR